MDTTLEHVDEIIGEAKKLVEQWKLAERIVADVYEPEAPAEAEAMNIIVNCLFRTPEHIADSACAEVKFGNVVFDISAIADNIRAYSDELKSKIDARMSATLARMGERH